VPAFDDCERKRISDWLAMTLRQSSFTGTTVAGIGHR
jgi:hypothetical protein